MHAALCTLSHSPLIGFNDPPPAAEARVEAAFDHARNFVAEFNPELVVLFAPDHYNGFFYDMMPPFCVGAQARALGDYGTPAGPLAVDSSAARRLVTEVLAAGVDIALSERMYVDHGFAQPLDILFGGVDTVPVVPVFINSVAEPLCPVGRIRKLGDAIGQATATLGQRVLFVGSGGLSHDPPVPQLATATPEVAERLIAGRNPTAEERHARQTRVIQSGRDLAAGTSTMRPLNPTWDNQFLDIIASGAGALAQLDAWNNEWFVEQAGHSSHEVRTWIAAYAAMAAQGDYMLEYRFYEDIKEWVAGFALTTAVPAQ